MQPLAAAQLLTIWEQGLAQTPAQWALALLAAACPDEAADALEQLSIGARDGRLLTLREWTFGPQLACLAACPQCGEKLDLAFTVADIRAIPAGETAEHTLTLEGYDIQFRLPNSLDATAVLNDQDTAANQRLLFQRCLLAAHNDDEVVTADALPDAVVEAVISQMAEADPQADTQLVLDCPACGHHWSAAFDIVTFFWAEINTWAYRALHEVHLLATAYGWHEADILAQSPWRRQVYLAMVRL
jgi:uncharacterized protein (UPF0212 family)